MGRVEERELNIEDALGRRSSEKLSPMFPTAQSHLPFQTATWHVAPLVLPCFS